MWMEHENLLEVVKTTWDMPIRGDPFFQSGVEIEVSEGKSKKMECRSLWES